MLSNPPLYLKSNEHYSWREKFIYNKRPCKSYKQYKCILGVDLKSAGLSKKRFHHVPQYRDMKHIKSATRRLFTPALMYKLNVRSFRANECWLQLIHLGPIALKNPKSLPHNGRLSPVSHIYILKGIWYISMYNSNIKQILTANIII